MALVLSDERMPGMGGVDLLTKVREVTPDTKRVLLTAYADTDVAITWCQQGAPWTCISRSPGTRPSSSRRSTICSTVWRTEYRQETHRTALFGDRWSREYYELREFLSRNRVPFRFHDTATTEGREALRAEPSAIPHAAAAVR